VVERSRHRYSESVTLRLPSRPLLALAGLALLVPAGASAANPSPVAAPSNPAPVAATNPAPPPAPTHTTYTPSYTRTYTPPAPSGPTAAQLAAQRAAAQRASAQAKARKLAEQRHRHQMQLLAAAQTHAEAVLRTELTAARRSDAVDTLAVSVADSIGAAPAGGLPRAAASTAASGGGGGGASIPIVALALAACAGLLGLAAGFAARRGVGLATAALSLIVLLVAGI
jgi:hypothetical protein